ncbi:MAG: phosphoenolpyruvate carboxykinase domain-containing protein [Candidatus Nanopelagicales bacterium]
MLEPGVPGWKVETVGDDIAWMRFGDDGRLYAINPEAGFFGVAPGTGMKTNANAIRSLWGNSIFTNVALTDDGDVVGGHDRRGPRPPDRLEGQRLTPESDAPSSHPNARFTAPTRAMPVDRPELGDPPSVPISAILFGGRQATNIPLVNEAELGPRRLPGRDHRLEANRGGRGHRGRTSALRHAAVLRLQHGRLLGSLAQDRRDDRRRESRPGLPDQLVPQGRRRQVRLAGVRRQQSRAGVDHRARVEGRTHAEPTAIGGKPKDGDLYLEGLDLTDEQVAELFAVDPDSWLSEAELTEEYFAQFGDKVPAQLRDELAALRQRLEAAKG